MLVAEDEVPSGSYIGVGVGIDTTDVESQENWESGSVEVEFTDDP